MPSVSMGVSFLSPEWVKEGEFGLPGSTMHGRRVWTFSDAKSLPCPRVYLNTDPPGLPTPCPQQTLEHQGTHKTVFILSFSGFSNKRLTPLLSPRL